MRAVFDKVSADERKAVVRRAQKIFADGCPRHSRRGKGGQEVVDNKGKR